MSLAFEWAWDFVDALAAAGVRDVVLSPGSRSTPLALAALRHPSLEVSVIVDERSAAFFALGKGRVTGKPSVLVCTSGTAGAGYAAAVAEAGAADVPLLVVTADRPPELRGRGALQTMDQLHFFGTHVRAFIDLGTPDAAPEAREGARTAASLAVARSLDPRPGPVHVNAPFRKPLEPDVDEGVPVPHRPAPAFFPPERMPSHDALDRLADACRRAHRPMILAGPASLQAGSGGPSVARLARRLHAPILAEATSQLRFAPETRGHAVGLFEYLLPPAPGFEPDLVLQLGGYPTSAAAGRWLETTDVPRFVLAPHGWHDPANRAAGIVAADVQSTVEGVLERIGELASPAPEWLELWRGGEAAADAWLTASERSGVLDEATASRAVVRALPHGALLALANSLAIREVDVACPPWMATAGVLSQRGVSGIDGLVSGAAGSASAADRPVALLIGDVAFAHDIGGLAALRHAVAPVAVVVLNNGGGRIFDLLPVREVTGPEEFRAAFTAPVPMVVGSAAAAFGLPYRKAASPEELSDAVRAALAEHTMVIEAMVAGPGVRPGRLALRDAVRQATRGGTS